MSVPTKYQRLKPPKPPSNSGVPKWDAHRLVVEKPRTTEGAKGDVRHAQRAYCSRHCDDSVSGNIARSHDSLSTSSGV